MIDAFASEAHFLDHLAPVIAAIPAPHRGQLFVASPELAVQARDLGIPATIGLEGQPDHPILVASIGDLRRARRAERSRVALMEHGAGQSYAGDRRWHDHPSYAGGAHRDADLFLHPGPHPAGRDRAAYPGARIEIVGCPKLDTLPRREPGPGPAIAVSFHWHDPRSVPEVRSGFVAFRDAIAELAQRFTVLGHGHPRLFRQMRLDGWEEHGRHRPGWYERHGLEVVKDFRDVCRRADLFIADNTSALFEFAATGRPVVLLDPPHFRRGIQHGLRFGEAADVGLHCDRPGSLIAVVEDALADPPAVRARRERALSAVYGFRSGAAERAADALLRWTASLEVLAA